MKTRGVYIHIPFCNHICTYCDFCKMLYNDKFVDKYLDALSKEIEDRYLSDKVSTIYIGGGTPSALNTNQLSKLFDMLKIFKQTKDCERTFECNLNDINENLIDILVNNEINRVSIGIESFNEDKLSFMNRSASLNETKEKINLLKSKGITNINIDLIYALPFENIKMLHKDLQQFMKLKVNHISTYSLMIEPNTVLYNQKTLPIEEELDAKMYNYIRKFLKHHKYKHYEVSNFSKSGYESKHNLKYWNNEEYYGFGLGASGYFDGVRYDNTRNLTKYLEGEYTIYREFLSKEDKMKYEVILGLRKLEGIDVKQFYKKYHINIQKKYNVNNLLKTKDLIYKNGYLKINPNKIYIQNEILVKLL